MYKINKKGIDYIEIYGRIKIGNDTGRLLITFPTKLSLKLRMAVCAVQEKKESGNMKKISKFMAFLLTFVMVASTLLACGKKETTEDTGNDAAVSGTTESKDTTDTDTEEKVDEIYYLNFKPEIADVYEKNAAEYKAETGVTVKVVTAASGNMSRP